jgi:hypothetical protein
MITNKPIELGKASDETKQGGIFGHDNPAETGEPML